MLILGKVAATVADAVSPVLLVRLLDKPSVGAISALLLVHATVATLVATGLARALLYYLADRPLGERRTLAWRIIQAQALLALAGTGILVLLGWLWPAAISTDRLDPSWLFALALYAVFDLPTRLQGNLLVAEQRARGAAAMGVLRSILQVCAILLPAGLGLGVGGILTGLTLLAMANLAAMMAWTRHIYKDVAPMPSAITAREMINFAWPLAATDVVSWLNEGLDRYIIMGGMNVSRFAEYRAGSWKIPVLTTIPYSIGIVDTPLFVELFRAGKAMEAMRLWRQSVVKVALVVVPVSLAFAAAADPFIRIAFTEDYAAAAPVFRCYCIVTMLRVASFGNVVVAAGRPGAILRASIISLGSNLVLSIPLFLWLGFVGPALGTLLAVVPTYLAWSMAISDAAGVPFKYTFPWLDVGKVVAVCAPGAIAAWALGLHWSYGDWPLFFVQTGLTMVSALLLGVLTGVVGREDWVFVQDWVRLRALRGGRPEGE